MDTQSGIQKKRCFTEEKNPRGTTCTAEYKNQSSAFIGIDNYIAEQNKRHFTEQNVQRFSSDMIYRDRSPMALDINKNMSEQRKRHFTEEKLPRCSLHTAIGIDRIHKTLDRDPKCETRSKKNRFTEEKITSRQTEQRMFYRHRSSRDLESDNREKKSKNRQCTEKNLPRYSFNRVPYRDRSPADRRSNRHEFQNKPNKEQPGIERECNPDIPVKSNDRNSEDIHSEGNIADLIKKQWDVLRKESNNKKETVRRDFNCIQGDSVQESIQRKTTVTEDFNSDLRAKIQGNYQKKSRAIKTARLSHINCDLREIIQGNNQRNETTTVELTCDLRETIQGNDQRFFKTAETQNYSQDKTEDQRETTQMHIKSNDDQRQVIYAGRKNEVLNTNEQNQSGSWNFNTVGIDSLRENFSETKNSSKQLNCRENQETNMYSSKECNREKKDCASKQCFTTGLQIKSMKVEDIKSIRQQQLGYGVDKMRMAVADDIKTFRESSKDSTAVEATDVSQYKVGGFLPVQVENVNGRKVIKLKHKNINFAYPSQSESDSDLDGRNSNNETFRRVELSDNAQRQSSRSNQYWQSEQPRDSYNSDEGANMDDDSADIDSNSSDIDSHSAKSESQSADIDTYDKGGDGIRITSQPSCNYCFRIFQSDRMLLEHLKTFHRITTGFESLQNISKSAPSELSKNCRVNCKACKIVFQTKNQMITHFNRTHRKFLLDEKLHICLICNNKFKKRLFLKDHFMESHTEDISTGDSLKKHVLPQDPSKKSTVQHNLSNMASYSNESNAKMVDMCLVCNLKMFKSTVQVEDHLRTAHGEIEDDNETFTCLVCARVFKIESEFLQHMKDFHTHLVPLGTDRMILKLPMKCKICGEVCKQLRLLRRHMERQHIRNVRKCPVCGFTSILQKNLNHHIITAHTTDKPFKCKMCQESFDLQVELDHHKVIHGIEREDKFPCEICGQILFSKTKWTRHLKSQHSITDYQSMIKNMNILKKNLEK